MMEYLIVAFYLFVIWFFICAVRALRKNHEVCDRCVFWLRDNRIKLEESQGPGLWRHAFRLATFRNPKAIYGPLLQSAWDRTPVLDTRWWMIYNKIYLGMLDREERDAIRQIMARKQDYPPGLEGAIFIYMHADINKLIGWPKPIPKNDMSEAAKEYEEIMVYEELVK